MDIKKIFIVPYCHPDWAWVHTRNWHEQRYCLVLNEVLDIMNENEDFRHYIDSYITFLEPFIRNHPERFKELKKRVKEGKIAICGTYTNLRVNMVGEETFIRDIIYGRRIFNELFPEAELAVYAGNVDVAVGHPQLPQILKRGGYKYFRFWRPHAALSAKNIPYEFIWKGIDGSEIICSRGSYAGLFKEIFPDKSRFLNEWEKAKNRFFELEVDYAKKLSKTKILWISQGGDDIRPLRTYWGSYPGDEKLDLIEFINEWNKREKVKILFGNPLEYFREIEKEKLPVIEGTIDPCDVCYNVAFGGSSGLWYLRVIADKEITNAEKISSVASIYGFKYPEEKFENLWKDILLFSSHATQWLFQNDFNEIYTLALKTIYKIEEIEREAIEHLVSSIKFREKPVAVVFNFTNFSSSFYVKFFISSVDKKLDRNFILRDSYGNLVPYQIINYLPSPNNLWEVEVLAKVFLPSLGYNSIFVEKGKTEENFGVFKLSDLNKIENDKISLRFEEGNLIEVKGSDFIYKAEKDSPFGNLKIFHLDPEGVLHIGKFLREENVVWKRWAKIEDGGLRKIFRTEGKVGKHKVKRDVVIYKGEERVEFDIEMNYIGEENAFVLFSCPLIFFDGRIYGDIPFGIEEKDIENQPYGGLPERGSIERLIEGMFFAKSFVDYTDGEKTISLIPHNGDRYFIWDKDKKNLSHIMLRSFKRPEDTWEKDITEKIEGKGEHRFKYSVVFQNNRPETYKMSEVLRNSPYVIQRLPGAEKSILNEKNSFIEISPSNIILTAFYKEGDRFILRAYETEGKDTELEINLNFSFQRVFVTDLIGNEIRQKVKIAGNRLKLRCSKYEILTLSIQ